MDTSAVDWVRLDALQEKLSFRESATCACVSKHLIEPYRHKQRSLGRISVPSEVDSSYGLLQAFGNLPSLQALPSYTKPGDLRLFEGRASRPDDDRPATLGAFQQRFAQATKGLLDGHLGLYNNCGLVAAGGSISQLMRGGTLRERDSQFDNPVSGAFGDVDVFVIGDPATVAPRVFTLLDQLNKLEELGRLEFSNKVGSLDVVLRPYPSVLDLLTDFDTDCSKWAYDGTRVLTTYSGLVSNLSGVNVLAYSDVARVASHSMARRFLKYMSRGYEVSLRGFPTASSRLDQLRSSWNSRPFTREEVCQADGLRKLLMAAVSWERLTDNRAVWQDWPEVWDGKADYGRWNDNQLLDFTLANVEFALKKYAALNLAPSVDVLREWL